MMRWKSASSIDSASSVRLNVSGNIGHCGRHFVRVLVLICDLVRRANCGLQSKLELSSYSNHARDACASIALVVRDSLDVL